MRAAGRGRLGGFVSQAAQEILDGRTNMPVNFLPGPGTAVEEFETPALVVDLDVAEMNLRKMQSFADKHGMGLRPHSKTHKSPYWAHKQLDAGAGEIFAAQGREGRTTRRLERPPYPGPPKIAGVVGHESGPRVQRPQLQIARPSLRQN